VQANRTAVVVGAGPNGLAAAVELARAGWRVTVYEADEQIGGGARTAELTLPGYAHDVCSAVHPLGAGSPFFRSLPLAQHGLEWVHPNVPLAHPLDDGSTALLHVSLDATARGLGADGDAYQRLMQPFADGWAGLAADALGPVIKVPSHPLLMARFGLHASRSASGLARGVFQTEAARALFAGIAAHVNLPLDERFTASFALMLGAAGHAVGWPLARGGSQAIVDALASYLRSLGGEVVTGRRIGRLSDLSPVDATLLDLTPRQIIEIAGERLPEGYRRQLRGFQYGPGAFKVDFALDGPVPWTSPDCARAGTVHLGGPLAEIEASERDVAEGRCPEQPFVLVSQPSAWDHTRAPAGRHVVWAYCHVPNGSDFDMTQRIEAQIERFAPGFRARILAKHAAGPRELQRYNENYIGGDIGGGSMAGLQLFMRPAFSLTPYATPVPGLYICSSSTPPGGGVHGMCGYHAARTVLKRQP
jgi:phytoene dehydrogenase-like protein